MSWSIGGGGRSGPLSQGWAILLLGPRYFPGPAEQPVADICVAAGLPETTENEPAVSGADQASHKARRRRWRDAMVVAGGFWA
jgi:hypothetical protein